MNTNYIYEDKNKTDICIICGSDSAYYVFETEDEDERGKYYCANCESEYMYTGTEYRDVGELVILKGEKRDWLKILNENVSCPFECVVSEFQERGPLQQGNTVVVKKIEFEHDFYGVLVDVSLIGKKQPLFRRKKFLFPLVDLRAKDERSKHYRILKDYSAWFFNCRNE